MFSDALDMRLRNHLSRSLLTDEVNSCDDFGVFRNSRWILPLLSVSNRHHP